MSKQSTTDFLKSYSFNTPAQIAEAQDLARTLKTTNKNLIYKVGWLFAVYIKDPYAELGDVCSHFPIKKSPHIFTGTDLLRHYPSAALLFAYTCSHP